MIKLVILQGAVKLNFKHRQLIKVKVLLFKIKIVLQYWIFFNILPVISFFYIQGTKRYSNFKEDFFENLDLGK